MEDVGTSSFGHAIAALTFLPPDKKDASLRYVLLHSSDTLA